MFDSFSWKCKHNEWGNLNPNLKSTPVCYETQSDGNHVYIKKLFQSSNSSSCFGHLAYRCRLFDKRLKLFIWFARVQVIPSLRVHAFANTQYVRVVSKFVVIKKQKWA